MYAPPSYTRLVPVITQNVQYTLGATLCLVILEVNS